MNLDIKVFQDMFFAYILLILSRSDWATFKHLNSLNEFWLETDTAHL